METQRTICRASVHPHRHTNEMGGPLDLKIGYRSQPSIVRDWPKKRAIRIQLIQPDERTNLTIIELLFDYYPHPDTKRYNINQYRIKKTNSLTCYLKARITRSVDHPIPVGRYEGTCEYTDSLCMFTFQAMTMKVKPEEPLIVLPDGLLPENKTRIVLP